MGILICLKKDSCAWASVRNSFGRKSLPIAVEAHALTLVQAGIITIYDIEHPKQFNRKEGITHCSSDLE